MEGDEPNMPRNESMSAGAVLTAGLAFAGPPSSSSISKKLALVVGGDWATGDCMAVVAAGAVLAVVDAFPGIEIFEAVEARWMEGSAACCTVGAFCCKAFGGGSSLSDSEPVYSESVYSEPLPLPDSSSSPPLTDPDPPLLL